MFHPNDQVGMPPSQRPSKRPRVLVACLRCKARRQKCDNQSPACSNCAKAKLSCTFAENEYPSSYVKRLEERIAWLESHPHPSQNLQKSGHPLQEFEITGTGVAEESSHSATKSVSRPNFASSVGHLSLEAAAEPRYFGVSSGVSLAQMIETAVYENGRPSSSLNISAETDSLFTNVAPTIQTTARPPFLEREASFINAYLSFIHPHFPFLSTKRLWHTHRSDKALESIEINDAEREVELEAVALQLVYAIGSRCLQLLGSPNASGVEPDGYYASAIGRFQDKFKIPSVKNIEIILLVAIYGLRSPSGSSVWHLCGLMIRQCVELGLHRQLSTDNTSIRADESKKRLFWSIYHLERRVALVLGRPLAISDDEIDINLPTDVGDGDGDGTASAEIRPNHRASNSSGQRSWPKPQSKISIHVYLLQLDHLNSKSRLTLSRLAKSDSKGKAERKIAKRFQELEDWKDTIFESSAKSPSKQPTELISSTPRTPPQTPASRLPFQERERLALLLSYHRARRLLLQTILTDVKIPNRIFEFSSFAQSSGEVCQLNRRLHRLKSVPFTLLDLHSVFVAGFSMIYCVWVDPELYDAEMAADFGACSTVLYVISEQWASAKKYRDAFEIVAEKTAEFVSSTGRSRHSEQRIVSTNPQLDYNVQIADSATVVTNNESNLSDTMPHSAYDIGRAWGDYSVNDSFDVWQLMNQFAQTQEYSVEHGAVNLTGIEELLVEEGLGWFNGSTSGGF